MHIFRFLLWHICQIINEQWIIDNSGLKRSALHRNTGTVRLHRYPIFCPVSIRSADSQFRTIAICNRYASRLRPVSFLYCKFQFCGL